MMEHSTSGMHDIRMGSEVYTSDGDLLGHVREVHGGYFKVNASMQPDYWLPDSTVASSMGDRITLTFVKDRLGDYKASEPRAA